MITRTDDDGLLERHNLLTEQVPLTAIYSEGLFEAEIGRIVEQYGNIAHAWSSYEVRNTPDGPTISRGISSVSMYFDGAAGGLHHGLPSQKVTSQYQQDILRDSSNSADRETLNVARHFE